MCCPRLAMTSICLALTVILAPNSWAQLDAEPVLAAATEAAKSLRTATYEARLEIRSDRSQQVVVGEVFVTRFDFSDTIGGKVFLRGEVRRADTAAQRFETAYNGQTVWRLLPDRKVLMQGDLHYGGSGIFSGAGQQLFVKELIATDPFAQERGAPTANYVGIESVNGEPCDVIDVQYEAPRTNVRWYFATKDHLPRRYERHYRSASGNDVTAVLTLGNLQIDVTLDEAIFAIEQPEGYRLEILGKKPPPPLNVGDIAPNWTLIDSQGQPRSLSDYRGKLVVLDFWATWCGFCRKAMPAIQALHDEYADKGVAILAVNCRDATDADPVGFVRGQGYTYPVLLGGNSITVPYQLRGIPAFYVISPEGRLLHHRSGFNAQQEQWLRGIIESYLNGTN